MKPSKADKLIYKALTKSIEEDKLRIYLDYAKINRPSSPVYDPWECLIPILLPTFIGLLLILSVGIFFGLTFIVLVILLYSTYFKKKLYHKLIERTKNYITSDYENCENLWKFGGIVLVNHNDKKIGCVSPDGDWKEFVVKNFSEFMVENKNKDEKKDEKSTSATA